MNKEREKIEDLGWDDFFEAKKTELGLGGFLMGRVISEHKGGYMIKSPDGEYAAKIRGRQMFRAASREDYPAVGDWVAFGDLENNQAIIHAVLPRKTLVKRTFGDKNRRGEKNDVQLIAANIDAAFLVQSVGRDYNINRLERYLAIVENAKIKPVIIINKIDLISSEELELKLAEIKNRLGDMDIIPSSTINNEGLTKLKNYIERGKTYCFLGSSGVGKSSLINKILGKNNIKTGDVSNYSERGKHVTTKRAMYFLESGAMLIDNPGIREIGMTDNKEGISNLFEEIMVLAKNCKYADCTHIHEPGCAVIGALEAGRLDRNRYANYLNIQKETEYFDRSDREKREKNRDFGKFTKQAKKDLKKFRHKHY